MDELGVLYNSIPCNARTVASIAITSLSEPHEASARYVLATLLSMRLETAPKFEFSLLRLLPLIHRGFRRVADFPHQ